MAAQQQAGETQLLKTQSDISLAEAQNRRAERQLGLAETADVRAGEAHGQAMKLGAFNLDRAQQLLPGELALQRSGEAAQRASVAASTAAAHASRIRAEVDQFALQRSKDEYAQLTAPIKTEDLMQQIGGANPELAQLFKGAFNPGETTNVLQVSRMVKLAEQLYGPEMAGIEAAGIDRRINDPNTPPEQLVALQQRRRSAMERAGKHTTGGDEQVELMIADRLNALDRTTDPAQREAISDDILEVVKLRNTMRIKAGTRPQSMADIKPEELRNYEERVLPDFARRRGYNVGSLNDQLIDAQIIAKPDNYVTPNDLYPRLLPLIKPATPEEWRDYRAQDPSIDTQEKADRVKQAEFVEKFHRQIGGDRQRAIAMLQAQPSTPQIPPSGLTVGESPQASQLTPPTAPGAPPDPIEQEARRRLTVGGFSATPERLEQMRQVIQGEQRQNLQQSPTVQIARMLGQALGHSAPLPMVRQAEALIMEQGYSPEEAIRLVIQVNRSLKPAEKGLGQFAPTR